MSGNIIGQQDISQVTVTFKLFAGGKIVRVLQSVEEKWVFVALFGVSSSSCLLTGAQY